MINTTRVGAVIRKELAEIRRNRLILVTACILPIIFLVEPTVEILLIKASATSATLAARVDTSLFLPLLVPVLIPATMSAFSVVGEREQGTLEPVLTTPVTRVEFILGKAAAIFMPAVGLSYLVLGVFVAIVALFARPAVATEMWNAPQLPAEAVFMPLLAAGRSGSACRSHPWCPIPGSHSSSRSWGACRRWRSSRSCRSRSSPRACGWPWR